MACGQADNRIEQAVSVYLLAVGIRGCLAGKPMTLPPYLEHFTDRQDQIAAFDALWPGDGRWLLAFGGLVPGLC